mmetsp:Transcript_45591/g.105776  ORF Transcript_45591/g.105776 Transcript_45591/m.105776 type:complete len:197 (-) Transcript_45591:23-613(-)
MYCAFVFFNPPQAIADATEDCEAKRTFSHDLNFDLSCVKALCELMFVVFCDKMVPTTVSKMGRRTRCDFLSGRRSLKTFASAVWNRSTSAGLGRSKPGNGLVCVAVLAAAVRATLSLAISLFIELVEALFRFVPTPRNPCEKSSPILDLPTLCPGPERRGTFPARGEVMLLRFIAEAGRAFAAAPRPGIAAATQQL